MHRRQEHHQLLGSHQASLLAFPLAFHQHSGTAYALVNCRDIHDAIGINIKGDFNLRNTSRCWGDASQLKFAHGVAFDQNGHDATSCLNTQGQRGNIQQQQVLDVLRLVTRQDSSLDSCQ
ncbi:hypothetical protein JZ751_022771 [Albula glossodonta]|uniref:Uncharacterized protein n=1 Tax=Albula glossodonta TaxID=121402 RepID=A0A8T2PH77_9TELE|nr:hypothetical protein JZ751_022771 [Albula glossodonta]